MKITPLLKRLLREALREDIGTGDITTELLIPKDLWGECHIRARERGVLAGGPLIPLLFRFLDRRIRVRLRHSDGASIRKGFWVARLRGPLAPILNGERVALNFLGHLSGISTLTRKLVKIARPQGVRIFDTRKTTPLLRALEKYAVRCGGGNNHRLSLSGALFVKKNHLKALGDSWDDLARKLMRRGKRALIVEVEDLKSLAEALRLSPRVILLDNMTPLRVRAAWNWFCSKRRRGLHSSGTQLETSGGIDGENLRRYAATGIRRVSIGALTHSAPSLDFSLEVKKTYQKKTFRGPRGRV